MAKEEPAAEATVSVADAQAWMAFRHAYGKRKNVDFALELGNLIAVVKRRIKQNHPKSKFYEEVRLPELYAVARGASAMEPGFVLEEDEAPEEEEA